MTGYLQIGDGPERLQPNSTRALSIRSANVGCSDRHDPPFSSDY